jgi:hypothetical protein
VVDVAAIDPRDLGPALAEVTGGHGDDAVTGRSQVRDDGLQAGRPRGCVEQDLALRSVDVLQAVEALPVRRFEVRAAVMDDRKGHRGQHLRRNRRRPRRHQVALLGQAM